MRSLARIYPYYYSTSNRGEALLLSEDFSGTVVDTSKGTITNPGAANLSLTQNDGLIFKRVTDNAIATFLDYWQSVDSFSKPCVVAFTMQATVGFTNTAVRGGLFVDENNRAHFTNSVGTLRLVIVTGGVSRYNVDTGIPMSTLRELKITIDADNNIKFWRYTAGAWAQLGTTQTFNIGSSLPIRLSSSSAASDGTNETFQFGRVRVTSGDYATQTP